MFVCVRACYYYIIFKLTKIGGGGGGGGYGAVVFHLHSLFVFCKQLTTHCLKLLIIFLKGKKNKK